MNGDFSPQEKDGFYKAVFSRRDVRSQFTSEPIDDEVLSRILNAAHHAPSVGFSQPWNFILIKDHKARSEVKESFERDRSRSSTLIENPRKSKYLSLRLEGILDSALNLCVPYDPSKFGPFVIGRASIPETGIYSVCCAIQNLWLAARAEGGGVGWVSILSHDDLQTILAIPEHVVPAAYLCLGHVTNFAEKPDLEAAGWLSRLALKDVVYYERWNNATDPNWEQIQDMILSNFD